MNRTAFIALLLIICPFLLTGKAHQNGPLTKGKAAPDKDRAKQKAESKTWRITLVSAESRDKANLSPGEPGPTKAGHYLARLSLHIEYLGPDGEVKAPEFTLLDEKGNKYTSRGTVQTSPDLQAMKSIFWFLEKKTRPLKSGESLGEWQAFFFEIPNEITDLKMVFGDVPPLIISIR